MRHPPKALALDVVAVAISYVLYNTSLRETCYYLFSFVLSIFILFTYFFVQDCELLFLSNRPEKLIITNVLVPPIAIRPSVIMDGSQRFFSFYSPPLNYSEIYVFY